jgi:flagellar hook-length control protein FliK
MSFRLNPEHLGALRVELAQNEHGTSVRLTADNETARNLIVDAQPKLVAEARAQGVRISETHVDLAGGQAGDPRRQDSERRDPQLRTARLPSTPEEPAPESARNGSDRYA